MWVSGEKPKSTLLTMKCCVIELCLLTAREKKLSCWSLVTFLKVQKAASALEIEEELLSVCLRLLTLSFSPAVGDKG